MLLTKALLLGISFSLASIYLAYMVAKRKFFREAFEFLSTYSDEPITKDKRGLRKLRKIRKQLERARKRLMLLFFIHLVIFIMAYTGLVSTIYLIIPLEKMIVNIPIGIPLISERVDGGYVTHIVFIAFIGFMAPSYLFARIIKMTQPTK